MIFSEIDIAGPLLITLNVIADERGSFARSFCAREFEAAGLLGTMVQGNLTSNKFSGTIRGLHYQIAPSNEAKLVSCTRGSIHDVIVDLRRESPTFLKSFSVVLSASEKNAIYIPPCFAHGYQTLGDDTEVSYLMSDFYQPELDAGLRHDDPLLGIHWPLPLTLISSKDKSWPDFKALE